MRALKVAVPSAALMAGFLLCTSAGFGKQEYAKKEGQKCVTCHSKTEAKKEAMAANLTEIGKCYKENNHSLATCKVPEKK